MARYAINGHFEQSSPAMRILFIDQLYLEGLAT
jgi:hypothetical protein